MPIISTNPGYNKRMEKIKQKIRKGESKEVINKEIQKVYRDFPVESLLNSIQRDVINKEFDKFIGYMVSKYGIDETTSGLMVSFSRVWTILQSSDGNPEIEQVFMDLEQGLLTALVDIVESKGYTIMITKRDE
jgi:hypothetical protein